MLFSYNDLLNLQKRPMEKNLDLVQKEQYIYLTTTGRKSGRKYTKELWFAIGDGKIYLSHEGQYTDWMKNIAKNPSVAVKIGTASFNANARIVGGNEQSREIGKNSLYEKYYGPAAKEVIDDWFELSTVVELTLPK
jgi:deazaflavin-dependent oxidoreductase (nitroreductase family)